MTQVYVVSERVYKQAYYAEPFSSESIVKVFDDYHKTVVYICERIKADHKDIDESKRDLLCWCKYVPNPDSFKEGVFVKSVARDETNYYEEKSYRFRAYDVE